MLLLVGFVAAGTGGILDLVLPEPCSATESASSPADGSCPATCFRCHCTRVFDLSFHLHVGDAPIPSPEWLSPPAVALQPAPRDILHVPKPVLG
jgi:hypothetical protein